MDKAVGGSEADPRSRLGIRRAGTPAFRLGWKQSRNIYLTRLDRPHILPYTNPKPADSLEFWPNFGLIGPEPPRPYGSLS